MDKNEKEWTKIYQPKTMEDYVCEQDLRNKIAAYIRNDMRTPLIFEGKAGTGKTTLAKILGYELKADFHEYNASVDNGIDFVRNTIKPLVKQQTLGGKGLKVILFDEADELTTQAQDGLRRVIDDYSKNNVFIFCTNIISKIILPIQSRSDIIHFGAMRTATASELVQMISERADMPIRNSEFRTIIDKSGKEPRQIIKMMQALHSGMGIPKTREDLFKEFLDGIYFDEDPLNLLKMIGEEDLNDLANYLFEKDYDVSAKLIKIIADTDMAMQRSINKDVHLLNMIVLMRDLL